MTQHITNDPLAIALRTRDLISVKENWTRYSRLDSKGRSCLTGHILRAIGCSIGPSINDGTDCFQPTAEQKDLLTRVCEIFGFANYIQAERHNDGSQYEDLLVYLDARLSDHQLRQAEQEEYHRRIMEEQLV